MSKLLIVDDEINIRELIKKYATFEGHEVTDAVNGLDAIKKCENNDFDLVVMDVMMPELDGFSAVKEIRKTKNIPIIMLSARGEEYDRLHGFDLGIDDYVASSSPMGVSRETGSWAILMISRTLVSLMPISLAISSGVG